MVALAKQLKLDDDQARLAGMAGLLHDLGKAAVPLSVLNKPGKLTDKEFTVVRSHPVEGYHMLKESGNVADAVLDACLHHHEKIDGTGYPDKLKGENISVIARMTSICDVYDAVTSDRPYKRGWDPSESCAAWPSGPTTTLITHVPGLRQCIGIYPVVRWLRLTSVPHRGVMEQAPAALTMPSSRFLLHQIRPAHSHERSTWPRGLQRKDRGARRPGEVGLPDLKRCWSGLFREAW